REIASPTLSTTSRLSEQPPSARSAGMRSICVPPNTFTRSSLAAQAPAAWAASYTAGFGSLTDGSPIAYGCRLITHRGEGFASRAAAVTVWGDAPPGSEPEDRWRRQEGTGSGGSIAGLSYQPQQGGFMKAIKAVFGSSAAAMLLAVSPADAQSRTEQL